ncbi:hypothetical protein BgiBS90_030031 [Biomphalaria glabrata]|nr:hypothetical protein BgiBS90_030031 [Biomphalaria glabrata]
MRSSESVAYSFTRKSCDKSNAPPPINLFYKSLNLSDLYNAILFFQCGSCSPHSSHDFKHLGTTVIIKYTLNMWELLLKPMETPQLAQNTSKIL